MNNGQMAVGRPSDPWSLATGLALTQAAKRVSITPRPRLSRCAQVRTRDSTTRGARRPAARSQHGADSQNAQSAVRRRPASERSATTRASTAIISPARCTGCKRVTQKRALGRADPGPRADGAASVAGRTKERSSWSAGSKSIPDSGLSQPGQRACSAWRPSPNWCAVRPLLCFAAVRASSLWANIFDLSL
jgi:hypothetical protein